MKAKKLPSGNYRAQAFKNGMRKSFTADTKRAAEMAALEWQMSIHATPEKMTFGEAVGKYVEIKSNVLSPSTIRSYIIIKDNAFAPIRNIPLQKIDNIIIQTAINEYAAAHSPKSVRNAYGLLTAVLKMYRPEFTPSATLPQKKKVEIYVPSENEIKGILQLVKGTTLETPLKLAIFGGLRAGEICALTPSDINGNIVKVNKTLVYGKNREWSIKAPKTYSGNRTVILPQNINISYIDNNRVQYYINPNALSTAYRRFLKANNIPPHRFHDLRHFYISTLFDIGIPEKYIIAQVGHSSSSLTKRVYDHITAGKQTNYSDIISQHFTAF